MWNLTGLSEEMQGIRTIVGEYYCFDTATLIVTIHFPMFSQLTLDSTTLFYFNLSNNAQQGNSTRTVDMWIGEVTPHLNDCSAHGLPSLTVSKTSASTETVLMQSAFFSRQISRSTLQLLVGVSLMWMRLWVKNEHLHMSPLQKAKGT